VGVRPKNSTEQTTCNYVLFFGRLLLGNIEVNTEVNKIRGNNIQPLGTGHSFLGTFIKESTNTQSCEKVFGVPLLSMEYSCFRPRSSAGLQHGLWHDASISFDYIPNFSREWTLCCVCSSRQGPDWMPLNIKRGWKCSAH